MLEIVQAGQAGKTSLLFDMHRLRKRVFFDRMKWNVHVTPGGLEVDEYDTPGTIYFLALNENRNVVGSWRLLPSTGNFMIKNIWPQFLESMQMSIGPHVWEISRFAIDDFDQGSANDKAQARRAAQELFCGLAELSQHCAIQEAYALYNISLARLLRRLECGPVNVSKRHMIDGMPCEVGKFVRNDQAIERLRKMAGIEAPLIDPNNLPPVLRAYRLQNCAGQIRPDYRTHGVNHA